MRRIFVPLQGTDDARTLLPLAGHLAARFGAQVEAALITDPAGIEAIPPAGLEEAPDGAVSDAAGTHAIFTRWSDSLTQARGAAVQASWREMRDGVVYASASLGRASDLVVTRGTGDRRFRDALLGSGRLTLLAAAGAGDGSALLEHAVVAWDGSAGAAHALGLSLVLLAQARSVRVVVIGRNTVGAEAREAILSYVTLHNPQARLVVRDNAHRQTGRALLDALREEPASVVIMGVCGRSHSPETARGLGGTVLKLVEDGHVPILTAR